MNYADVADEAAARQQMMIDVALANRKLPEFKFTGKCAWCSETISAGSYCDSDCRDDHQAYLRAQSQRSVA